MIACVLLLAGSLSRAQERYFYTGKDFGSEALYNPLNLLLNGSFDVIQLDGHSHEIASYPYGTLLHQIFWNVARPLPVISNRGWKNFVENELFPIQITRRGAQWWPNYQLHLIGGGMTYVAMSEWYEEHRFPVPKIFSAATMAAYHTLNEMVESYPLNGDVSRMPYPNEDHIADLYVFDIGGIILFSFDGVSEFFSRTLNLADWSLQPSFSLSPLTLQNNGQYFSAKWRIPFWERWYLFYLTGMNGLLGVSYKQENGAAISLGVGLRAKQLVQVQEGNVQQTADLVWNAGLFFDVQNSLLGSLFVSGLTRDFVLLNIYPGVLRLGAFSPGVWLSVDRDGTLTGGMVTRWFPGIAWQ